MNTDDQVWKNDHTWYPNPVRRVAIIMAVSTFALLTLIGIIFVVTRGLLFGMPLLIFFTLLSGILMLHILRIERR